MSKVAILLVCISLPCALFAQDGGIRITNRVSQKEIVIKENKRIKVKTTAGKKISGRFSINNDSIIINNEHFKLEDLIQIKRDPLLPSMLTSGFLIYGGALTAGFGAIIGLFVDAAAFWLTIPGSGMIYTGIKSPNFSRNYKFNDKWTFELVTNAD